MMNQTQFCQKLTSRCQPRWVFSQFWRFLWAYRQSRAIIGDSIFLFHFRLWNRNNSKRKFFRWKNITSIFLDTVSVKLYKKLKKNIFFVFFSVNILISLIKKLFSFFSEYKLEQFIKICTSFFFFFKVVSNTISETEIDLVKETKIFGFDNLIKD